MIHDPIGYREGRQTVCNECIYLQFSDVQTFKRSAKVTTGIQYTTGIMLAHLRIDYWITRWNEEEDVVSLLVGRRIVFVRIFLLASCVLSLALKAQGAAARTTFACGHCPYRLL